MKKIAYLFLLIIVTVSCSDEETYEPVTENDDINNTEELAAITQQYFGTNVDFESLENYANQDVPNYITKDNTGANNITDSKATLGRILFYDKKLSTNDAVSCASCHKQAFAFGDDALVSTGVDGVTGRHSMRLINSRFSTETRFFWDERAATLEEQTTQPIQDHVEMGFSGLDNNPDINDLLVKLSTVEYYPIIFEAIYGDTSITEAKLQECLAQFVRSIQSFDSKFDIGFSQTNNMNNPFPNYSNQENLGKTLFTNPPNNNGAGCIGCHNAPEFDIDLNSANNGVTGVFGNPTATDFEATRAPTLRDVFNANGALNGALMHDASMTTMVDVILHYNSIDPTNNPNLDDRLMGGPAQNGQQLNLTNAEVTAIEAFLKTLSGADVYTNEKWSNPFN